MTRRRQPWDGIIPAEEQELYRIAGLGGRSGLGQRPALLVIDVQYRSVGDAPLPIREAIRQYPTSCGEAGWRAIPHIAALVALHRAKGWPVIFPHVAPKSAHDQGAFAEKMPAIMGIPPAGYDFVAEVAPLPQEMRLPKTQASAFHGTPLAGYLVGLGVDTLVLAGTTTSGCVRATAVDGCSLNFKCVVPEDAVFDRSATSHAVNLFDIAHKYADVLPTEELLGRLAALPPRARENGDAG